MGSYQICHNNVCDSDKCSADGECPQGFVCESTCGYCEPVPGFCSSNNMCNNFDGICDIGSDPYTTCFWCDLNDNTCKPGIPSLHKFFLIYLMDFQAASPMTIVVLGTSAMTTPALRKLTVKMMPFVTRVLLGYVILTTLHTHSACTVREENV